MGPRAVRTPMIKPRAIFHITDRTAWAIAERQGAYNRAGKDGYIPCTSLYESIPTANRFFHGRRDLVLVKIDPSRLDETQLRVEEGRSGTRGLHVYPPLPLYAVSSAVPWLPEPDGSFRIAPANMRETIRP